MTPHVTVVGGGIVGVCAVAFLQKQGFRVTLVDSGAPGEGASFGNAGNISPGAVVPYLIPGVLRQAPKWLLDAEGPLRIRPGYFFKALPWFLAAARESTEERALATSRAMHEVHRGAFEAYDEITRGTEAAALIERCGQLYVSEHEGLAQGSALARRMREMAGVKTVAIDANGVREAEPTLAPIYKSGLLLPDNGRCKNPHQLVTILANEAVRRGAQIVRGRVTAFQREGDRVQAIVIDGTATPVERVVIAAGAASRALARALGSDLPLEAERGYHITVHDSNVMPRVTVTNRDHAFACAPMNVGLRVAGTAEFAGIAAAPNWERAELLKRQAKRMFPALELTDVSRWVGDRPSFPDGLPALGVAPGYANAFFAFGNGHFGITGGPVMGKVIAELVAGVKPSIDVSPFSPRRFTS
ncbi:MAG: NAD(P)/FAD-dependent oxidoreductase [Bacillota bacterium]